jgi:dimethylargininase
MEMDPATPFFIRYFQQPSSMFTHAIVRSPGPDAAQGLTTAHLGAADHQRLLTQHAAYVAALKTLGLELTHLAALPAHPDAYFIEDAALIFPELAIITRPGALTRRAEAEALAPVLTNFRAHVARLTDPATLDGGDVLTIGHHVFVGISERTNPAGFEQLETLLKPHGYSVTAVPVPAGLHLKSSVTAIDDVLVLTEALRSAFPHHRHLVVPAAEAYAANVLCINGTILMPAGFPRTRALLDSLRLPVVELDQSEVQKMDGALTCLSLRF